MKYIFDIIMYIDSHTHLYADQFNKNRNEVFQKIFNKKSYTIKTILKRMIYI